MDIALVGRYLTFYHWPNDAQLTFIYKGYEMARREVELTSLVSKYHTNVSYHFPRVISNGDLTASANTLLLLLRMITGQVMRVMRNRP